MEVQKTDNPAEGLSRYLIMADEPTLSATTFRVMSEDSQDEGCQPGTSGLNNENNLLCNHDNEEASSGSSFESNDIDVSDVAEQDESDDSELSGPMRSFDSILGINRFASLLNSLGLTHNEIKKNSIRFHYLKPKSENSDETSNCTICLDSFVNDDRVRRLSCLHLFHANCIDGWLIRHIRCPLCRSLVMIDYPELLSGLRQGRTIEEVLHEQDDQFPQEYEWEENGLDDSFVQHMARMVWSSDDDESDTEGMGELENLE